MKNKHLLRFFVCFLAFLLALPVFDVFASVENDVENMADKLLDCKVKELGYKNEQELIDGYLCDYAGVFSEWYIIALARHGKYDLSSYESALLKYLGENKITSATSRQKYALALLAVGSSSDYVTKTVEDSIGEQGIMSYVFGLHLLNNALISTKFTKDEVISKLLSLEIDGGGWSLTGQNADVDVTAMVIQALAPHYQSSENVKNAVDKAVDVLSQKQLSDGDYMSYGSANPESGAQVMIALSSLGIDCLADQRFIKNGNTLLDGIKKYELENGSFCHQIGTKANENATSQVFLALVSYLRMKNAQSPIFQFDKEQTGTDPITPNTSVTTAPSSTPSTNTEKPTVETDKIDQNGKIEEKISYKPIACAVIFAICAIICLILFVTKRGNVKNIFAVLLICAALVVFVLATNFQNAKDYYSNDQPKKENAVGVVKMSIRCDKIVGLSDRDYIPKDGVILKESEFEIEDGDTVYDILIEAAKNYSIQIENNGSDKMAYIAGINYIYEMDFGELSGWLYFVNGESAMVGCAEYELSDGDTIEWHYSLNFGEDLK